MEENKSKKRLGDILERNVDKRHYASKEIVAIT